MKVAEARAFVEVNVLQPALQSPLIDSGLKATIRNTLSWLPRFERVGDLIAYMDRFQGSAETPVYKGLKAAGLLTFEDIHSEFMAEFGSWALERTRLDDFVVGEQYTGSHLVIFAGLYDNRSGGILRIGNGKKLQAVIVKATLDGGKYANEWLSETDRLKYYLKSRNGQFREEFVENAAIISNPNVPVLVFYRQSASETFTFSGAFHNAQVHIEADGSKWFELAARPVEADGTAVDEATYRLDLIKRVQKSASSPREQRLARLKVAPTRPVQITTIGKAYHRNPDVVAEVLFNAAGVCEGCKTSAPFKRNADGSPYLEVHHRTHLSEGGDDTVENAIALCPNCHRQEHHGPRLWG